jgi:hypothetical protein
MEEEFKTYFRLLEDHMVSMESRLNARTEGAQVGLRAHIDQRCERVETTLLKEFHKWAGPLELENPDQQS